MSERNDNRENQKAMAMRYLVEANSDENLNIDDSCLVEIYDLFNQSEDNKTTNLQKKLETVVKEHHQKNEN